jgi:hypothetical protein
MMRPPLILLLGTNRTQLAKLLAEANLWTSLPNVVIRQSTVL